MFGCSSSSLLQVEEKLGFAEKGTVGEKNRTLAAGSPRWERGASLRFFPPEMERGVLNYFL